MSICLFTSTRSVTTWVSQTRETFTKLKRLPASCGTSSPPVRRLFRLPLLSERQAYRAFHVFFLIARCYTPLTCMESALIISPRSRRPISIANFDFPVPVAPSITTRGGRTLCFSVWCTAAAAAIVEHARRQRGRTERALGTVTIETWTWCFVLIMMAIN